MHDGHGPDSQQDTSVRPPASGGLVRPGTVWTDPGERPDGVRVEYRARVPRNLVGAAFAEALAAIEEATRPDTAGHGQDGAGRQPDTAGSTSDDSARTAPPGDLRR